MTITADAMDKVKNKPVTEQLPENTEQEFNHLPSPIPKHDVDDCVSHNEYVKVGQQIAGK
jgi:hypothetical protein